MEGAIHPGRPAGVLCVLAMGALASLAGCAMLRPPSEPVPVLTASIPAPVVSTPVEPVAPPPDSEPVLAPAAAAPPVVREPERIAVLYSGGAPAQLQIAERLSGPLHRDFAVQLVDIDDSERGLPIDSSLEAGARAVAAIGPRALEEALARFARAAIVYCQVLDATAPRRARGIAAMPPVSLQFAAWAEADPDLDRIGLITSARFAAAVPDVARAAAAIGARLDHRISTSDRETLYIFRRLAPEVDGFWLAPDSTVLSAAVIDEILGLAAELEISVLVFNDNLLSRGGLLSVTARPDDVGDAAAHLIGTILAGGADGLPTEIPLTAGAVRLNAAVAAALGLPAPSRLEWVVRERR